MHQDPAWRFTFPEDLERAVRTVTRTRINLAPLQKVEGSTPKHGPSHTFRMHLDVEGRMMEEIAASLLLAPKTPLSWIREAASVMARRGNMHRMTLIEAVADVVEDIPSAGLGLPVDVEKELRRAMRSRLAGNRLRKLERVRGASASALREREDQANPPRPRPDFVKGEPRSAMTRRL